MNSRSTDAGAGLGIVLDLDDTLYLERDFVRSGFDAAGRHAAARLGLQGFGARCQALFDAGARGDVFDRALAQAGVAAEPGAVSRLVAAYRSHAPRIALAPDAARFLDRYPREALALLSDGPAGMQRAKVRALGLADRIGTVILTGAFGPAFAKPHPRAYRAARRRLGLPDGRMVYVADNALKDFVTPRAMGWRTIRVARAGRIHDAPAPTPAHAPDAVVPDLDGAAALLGAWLAAARDAA